VRVPRRSAALAIAVLLGATPWLGGCLFSPRDPDGPPQGDQTNWETPVSTAIVLSNMKAALGDESQANYRDCFTEDFRFHVDPADSLLAGEEADIRYANWTREDEEQAAGNIFAASVGVDLSLTSIIGPDESGDDTYREDDYELRVTFELAPGIESDVLYKGRAVLYLRRESGRWAIYRWADQRTVEPEQNETWGVLRGEYRE